MARDTMSCLVFSKTELLCDSRGGEGGCGDRGEHLSWDLIQGTIKDIPNCDVFNEILLF